MDERYYLTCDESTGFWWINDDLTGQCYETCQQDVEIARQVLAEHVLYSND